MSNALIPARMLAIRWGLTEKWLRNQRWLKRGPKFVRIDGRVWYDLASVKACEKRRDARRTS